MKSPLLLLASLLLVLLPCACSSRMLRGNVLELSYDDLGPEAMVRPVLGERGPNPLIIVRQGATITTSNPRYLSTHQALVMLRKNAHALPRTPENEPQRQRMEAAYSRLYHFYRKRRDAFLAVPPFFGRGSMNMGRISMMPPVPPTL